MGISGSLRAASGKLLAVVAGIGLTLALVQADQTCVPTGAHPQHSGADCTVCHLVAGEPCFNPAGPAVAAGRPVPSFDSSGKVCSNVACHASSLTPSWYSGITLGCNGCHGQSTSNGTPDYPNGSPKANSHSAHTPTCNLCHAATTSNGTTITNTSLHGNGVYDVSQGSGISFSYTYSASGGTCANVNCHGGANVQWGTSLTFQCWSCHGTQATNGAPSYTNGTPKANSHFVHNYACNICHEETTADGANITDTSLHGNGLYDLAPGPGTTFVYAYSATGGTCSDVNCHLGASGKWGRSPNHNANLGYGWFDMFADGGNHDDGQETMGESCDLCHLSDVVAQHNDNCAVCHTGANPAGALIGKWDRTCEACHGTIHPNAGHDYYIDTWNCDNCHDSSWNADNCSWCHSPDQTKSIFAARYPTVVDTPPAASKGNLRLLLHMNEAAWNGTANEVKDSSGSGSDGTAYGGASTVVGGVIGRAGSFNGSTSAVTVKYASGAPPMDTFTFEAWVKPNATHEIDPELNAGSTSGTGGERYLFWPDQRGAVDAGAGVSVGTNGISVYEHADNYMPALAVYTGTLSSTQWTHIAVVYQNKQPSIYVNGVLVRIGLPSQRTGHVYASQTVGGDVYGHYSGGVDEVAIYDAALTPTEIMQHAQQVCTSTSNTAISIRWTSAIASSSYVDYGLTTAYGATAGNSNLVNTHVVALTGLADNATYHYRVRSTTAGGAEAVWGDYTFATGGDCWTITTPPSAPTGISATPGNGQATVSWTAGAYSPSALIRYGTTSGSYAITVDPAASPRTITGLTNGTTYYYQVGAKGAQSSLGTAWSSEYSVTPVAPPSAPTGISATPASGQAAITWTAGTGATSSLIRYGTTSGNLSTTIDPASSPYTISSLTNGTTYYFQVGAKNSGGTTWNATIYSVIPAGLPLAPTAISATPGSGQATVTWTAGTGATSSLIRYGTTSGNLSTTLDPATSPRIITGLTNGTTYYFQVGAKNSYGTTWNSTIYSVMPVAPPSAPTGISAVAGNAQATITWTAGTGSTSSLIRYGTVSGTYTTTIDPATSTQTITGLVNGTTYYYQIGAKNSVGTTWSAQYSVTPLAPPAAPTGVSSAAGNTQATITWTAGTGSTSSNIRYGTTSGNYTTTLTAVTSPRIITGLTNGTVYYYQVGAVNAAGTTWSTEYSVTPAALPAAPTGISGASGNTQATITWTAGTGSTSSSLRYGTTSGNYTTTLTAVTSPRIITGLTNGTVYYYQVGAVNAVGTTWSAEASVTPLPPLPSAPTGISAVGGNTQATVTWTAGSGATSSSLRYGTVSGTYTTTLPGVTSPRTITGLTNGTVYYYQVGAVNLAGTTWSSQYSVTPTFVVAKPTVTAPTASSVGSTTALLGASVTSDGGGALAANGTCWGTSPSPTTNCVDQGSHTTGAFTQSRTGLPEGMLLYYRGYATNSAGTSYSADGTLYTEPTQPSTLSFTAVGNNGLAFSWAASSTGNAKNVLVVMKSGAAVDAAPVDATTYTANASFGSGSQLGTGNYVVYKGTGNTVVVTGLTPGTTYSVSVYAYAAGAAGTENYDTTSPAAGSQATSTGAGSTTINVTYADTSTPYLNRNIYADAKAAGWNGTSAVTINVAVNSGVVIGSYDPTYPGLVTNYPSATPAQIYPAGTVINLVNNGTIVGAGGYGGGSESGGGNGGDALLANHFLTVNNQGTIAGGGGGGGGGADDHSQGNGGSGGQGAGIDPAQSGQDVYIEYHNDPSTCVAVGGGAGGELGMSGNGGSDGNEGSYGGPGGAPGWAITGIAYVTNTPAWSTTGTFDGNNTQAVSSPATAVTTVHTIDYFPAAPPVAPAAPTGISAVAGNAQATISWTAGNGSTSSSIRYGTASGSYSTTIGAASPQTIPGLTNGTVYYYQVGAVNTGGTTWSAEYSVTPVLPLPSAPTGISSAFGNTQATITWTAGTGSTSSNIRYGTTSGNYTTTLTAVTSPRIITGLTNGTVYYYQVGAVNAAGTTWSTEYSVTPLAPPAAPTGISSAAGNTQATITWTAGTGSTSSNIRYGTTSGNYTTTLTALTSPRIITGLTNGTVYYYQVGAVNAAGTTWSTEYSVTPAALPAAPTGISGASGNTQATITWTAGSGSTSSSLRYGTTSGNYTTTLTAVTSPRIITGLTNGTVYYYQVGAVNAVGTTWSAEASVTPLPPLPSAPTGISAVGGNTQATVTWTAGSGATSSSLRYGTVSGTYTTTLPGVTSPRTITGLTNGTVYYYQVGAVNLAGTTWSSQYSVTPTFVVAKPTVTAPTASSVGSTTALLGASVTSDGGGALAANGTCWGTSPSPTTNCVDQGSHTTGAFTQSRTGLPEGMLLYYRGYATNSAGTSYSADGTLYTEPTQPSTLSFTAVGNNGLAFSWAASSTGNAKNVLVVMKSGAAVDAAPVDATTYTANASFGSGSQLGTGNYVVYKGTGNTVVVTGLTPGTTYSVSVYAYAAGAAGTENYDTTSPAAGSQATSTGAGSTTINVTYADTSTPYLNRNIYADAKAAGWNGTSAVTINVAVNSGVVIGSYDPTYPGLVTNYPSATPAQIYPAGTVINLVNNGTIVGAGGYGGGSESGGGNGGDALLANHFLTVNNQGTIAGGGGGGGGGADDHSQGNGGSGGQGAGIDPAQSGQDVYIEYHNDPSTCVAVGGGAGGELGMSGNGGSDGNEGSYGGPGGAPGWAITGIAYVTNTPAWSTTGTFDGNNTQAVSNATQAMQTTHSVDVMAR